MRLLLATLRPAAVFGLFLLSGCATPYAPYSADWSPAPLARDIERAPAPVVRNDLPRHLSPQVVLPEVLDVGDAVLAYYEAGPTPQRVVQVQPGVRQARPSQHVVAPGETLYAIARNELGDASRWRDIVAENPGLDASRIQAGQTLRLPPAHDR